MASNRVSPVLRLESWEYLATAAMSPTDTNALRMFARIRWMFDPISHIGPIGPISPIEFNGTDRTYGTHGTDVIGTGK